MNKTLTTLELFVTTKLFGGVANTQQKFDLVNFEYKDQFILEAQKSMEAITGQPNPDLIFTSLDDTLNATGLISEDDISENLWFLFKNSDTDESIYAAYCECFETADYTLKAVLEDIATSYLGHYDDDEALVEAYLQHHQLEHLPLAMIMNNLKMDGMAKDIKADLAYSNNHFFMIYAIYPQ